MILTLSLLAAGCSAKPVPRSEANEALKQLETIRHDNAGMDHDLQMRMLYSTCSDLPSCAGDCKRALAACAAPGTDRAQQGAMLADCFSDLKKEHAASGMKADLWFRGYFSKFLDRARAALEPEKQGRLDKLRTDLQLTGS